MAQVSCEVTVPKDSRPNEGILLLNIELSPMAAEHFEAGRRTDEAVCSFDVLCSVHCLVLCVDCRVVNG